MTEEEDKHEFLNVTNRIRKKDQDICLR